MATIINRGGRFLARVRITGYPAVSQTFFDKHAAEAWAASAADDIRRGRFEFDKQNVPTLGEALERYSRLITPTKRGARQETHVLNFWRRSPLQARRLDEIRPVDIIRIRDAALRDCTASTWQKKHSLLQHLFNVARREWQIDIENVMVRVSKPKIANRRERTIQANELAEILAHAPGDGKLAPIARLAAESAARLGELVALRWEHIDLDARTMHFTLTKNGSARTSPLSPAAVELLAGMRPVAASGNVFGVSVDYASKAWSKAVRRAREDYENRCAKEGVAPDPDWLRDAHFHDLRHSAISRLAEGGLSTLELGAISGHKTLSMLGRYAHVRPAHLVARLAALAQP